MPEAGAKTTPSKKDLAEAGRRKLEAFRKQRAAGKAPVASDAPQQAHPTPITGAATATAGTSANTGGLPSHGHSSSPTPPTTSATHPPSPLAPTHTTTTPAVVVRYHQPPLPPPTRPPAPAGTNVAGASVAAAPRPQPASSAASSGSSTPRAGMPTSTMVLLEQYRSKPPPRPPVLAANGSRHAVSTAGSHAVTPAGVCSQQMPPPAGISSATAPPAHAHGLDAVSAAGGSGAATLEVLKGEFTAGVGASGAGNHLPNPDTTQQGPGGPSWVPTGRPGDQNGFNSSNTRSQVGINGVLQHVPAGQGAVATGIRSEGNNGAAGTGTGTRKEGIRDTRANGMHNEGCGGAAAAVHGVQWPGMAPETRLEQVVGAAEQHPAVTAAQASVEDVRATGKGPVPVAGATCGDVDSGGAASPGGRPWWDRGSRSGPSKASSYAALADAYAGPSVATQESLSKQSTVSGSAQLPGQAEAGGKPRGSSWASYDAAVSDVCTTPANAQTVQGPQLAQQPPAEAQPPSTQQQQQQQQEPPSTQQQQQQQQHPPQQSKGPSWFSLLRRSPPKAPQLAEAQLAGSQPASDGATAAAPSIAPSQSPAIAPSVAGATLPALGDIGLPHSSGQHSISYSTDARLTSAQDAAAASSWSKASVGQAGLHNGDAPSALLDNLHRSGNDAVLQDSSGDQSVPKQLHSTAAGAAVLNGYVNHATHLNGRVSPHNFLNETASDPSTSSKSANKASTAPSFADPPGTAEGPWPRPGTPTGGSRASASAATASQHDFSTLHGYITELEKEKFELLQQIQQQHRTLHTLETQNQDMAEDYNKQGKQVSGLQEQIGKLRSDMDSQQKVLEQLVKEREGAKAAARETGERAKVLAAQIVELEERQRKTRSAELRLGKEVEALKDSSQQLQKRLERSEKDKTALQAMVNALQAEKKTLQGRLRQSGGSPAAAAIPSSPVMRPLTSDADTQTDNVVAPAQMASATAADEQAVDRLATELEQDDAGSGAPPVLPELVDASADVAADTPTHSTGPSTSGRITQLAVTQHKQAVLNQMEAATPKAASDGQGQRLMQVLPQQVLELLPQALLAGGVSEGTSLSIIQAVQAIDNLLFKVEADKQLLLQAVQHKQADCHTLRELNQQLQQKLEMQTQRLELLVQQAMVQGVTGPALWGPTGALVPNGQPPQSAPLRQGPNLASIPEGGDIAFGQLNGQAPFNSQHQQYSNGTWQQQSPPVGGPTPMPTPLKGVPATPPRRGVVGWLFGRR